MTTPALAWRKSSYSTQTSEDCVEVASLPAAAAVRDGKARERGPIAVSEAAWVALLDGVRRV
ncbi:DUF397 domain-containing protein [Streptomyces sp. SID3343]|uniref:DUF397 domain-containing protein n=1 Tax=Streptomyces sp. SID3343 TaxID=2690260 RepID=UPI001367E0E2|nr:DUF397 domain-containing protein [Streptomyces sp. SID3343]